MVSEGVGVKTAVPWGVIVGVGVNDRVELAVVEGVAVGVMDAMGELVIDGVVVGVAKVPGKQMLSTYQPAKPFT